LLLSSQSANCRKVELPIAIQDQARAPHEQKADALGKSKLKSRPSDRRAPLLRPLQTCAFRWLLRCQLIATICCTCRLLLYVLVSSESANRRKVKLPIARKDRARAPHEWKADVLVKSKLKRTAVRSSGSLAASTSIVRLFRWLLRCQLNCNNLLDPSAFVHRVGIEPKRQSPEGRAANCDQGSSAGA